MCVVLGFLGDSDSDDDLPLVTPISGLPTTEVMDDDKEDFDFYI